MRETGVVGASELFELVTEDQIDEMLKAINEFNPYEDGIDIEFNWETDRD